MRLLNALARRLKKKPAQHPRSAEQSGVSFTTALLDHQELFRKNASSILAPEAFHATGGRYAVRDGVHTLMGSGATGSFTVRGAKALALVFVRHPYSGVVRIRVDGAVQAVINLHAPFTFAEPIVVAAPGDERDIAVTMEIVSMPRHPEHCCEALLWKLLVPSQAREEAREYDESYYVAINKEQFNAWDRYVAGLGYTPEEASRVISDAYYTRLDRVFSLADPQGGILDIGCGYCSIQHLDALVERYAISRYHGHDISREVVDHGIGSAASLGGKYSFSSGANTSLPFPDNAFSFVYSGHCLEHSDDIQRTFSEIRRVLRPGGRLCFHVPLTWDESPEHIYYFNPLCWALLGREAGMRIHTVSFGPHYNPLQNDWDAEIVLVNAK